MCREGRTRFVGEEPSSLKGGYRSESSTVTSYCIGLFSLLVDPAVQWSFDCLLAERLDDVDSSPDHAIAFVKVFDLRDGRSRVSRLVGDFSLLEP